MTFIQIHITFSSDIAHHPFADRVRRNGGFMQEVFEKIIEKLEELKQIENNRPDSCDVEGNGDGEQIYDDGRSQGRYEQTVRIIGIVKQVAAEYNKDKYFNLDHATLHKCPKCGTYAEHRVNRKGHGKAIEDWENFCAKYNNGWIPCEKEMPPIPEESPMFENKPLELYLVSVEDEKYSFRAFWNGKIFTDGFSKVEATAWQPLPQPYQPKGE